MTNPYDPYPGQDPGQQPQPQPPTQPYPQADAAAPTQFVPIMDPAASQPQPPQQQAYYGAPQQQAYPQQAQSPYPQQQYPQQQYPQYAANPQQQPGPYDQQQAFGQQPPQSPYGVPGPQQAYPPYGAAQQQPFGYPTPITIADAKAQRGAGAKVASALVGTVAGRLALIAVIAVVIGVIHYAGGSSDGDDSGSQAGQTTTSTSVATDSPTEASTNPTTNPSTGIVANEVDIDALKTGDCFDAPAASTGIESFEVVACTQVHDSQVYGTATISGTALPDAATLDADADKDCTSLATLDLSSSVPSDAEKSYYAPEDEDSYDQGFNFIICTIQTSHEDLTKSYVTGS